MSLADLIEQRSAPRDRPCEVAALLATLDDRDAAALRAMLEPGVMDTDEARAYLDAAGLHLGEESLRRHKRTIRLARKLPTTGLRCSCPSQTI